MTIMNNLAIIERGLCKQVLMVGIDYKHCPGGMSSVVQYYEPYFNKLQYVPTYRYSNAFLRLVYFFSAICKIFFLLIFNRGIKIIHIHTAADGSFTRARIVINISRFFRKKILLHCHASRFKDFYSESDNKEKILNTISKVNQLVVLSKSWKDWFTAIGIPNDKIFVLNNLTSVPKIRKISRDGKVHLLFLGLLGQRKGIFDILKAINNKQELLRNQLVFKIGGNTHEKELVKKIEEYKLGDFVHFEGWVSGEKKRDLLNWADVYILPSYNEGLPIGILEAMSYGCAIISSPVGGIPEVVKNGKNGILVEPGNIEDIEDAIREVLNINKRRIMSQYSREIVKDYLPESVMGNLVKLYNSLLV